jgi:hypothetical protein
MSISNNIEYSALKKRAGLHNWAFMPSKDELEDDLGFALNSFQEQDIFSVEEVLQQNDHGEYFALQDFEE